jgi:hypothetical protein
MARAFIFITNAMRVKNASLIIDQRILEACAKGKTLPPEALRLI